MTAKSSTRPIFDFDADVANFRLDKNAKQVQALEALDSGTIKFLLYGGAMGPGKSYFLRWFAVRFLIRLFQDRGLRHVVVMLACEDYPALKDRQLVKIGSEFPRWLGQSYKDHGDYGRCFVIDEGYGGGVVCFRNLDDPSKYASAEFAAILIDELTKNTYQTFIDLKTRLRWPGLKDIECPLVCATNPGSKGHGWVKQLWIDKQFPKEWISPIDYRSQFTYIPGTADDNPYLDQSYWDSLNTLPEQQRRAFRFGDWNIFKGQAFPEVNKVAHGYRPAGLSPSAGVWVAMAMDWGFGAPFSIGWYHTDADGRLYRFNSWYGWNGTANKGLRLEDSAIANGIKDREKEWGINDRVSVRVLSPDCFQKKPDYRGGGQGPSTAEVFIRCGLTNIHPGDPSRALKIRQFRERVKVPTDGTAPMLLCNDVDEHFFRTIGSLVTAENDPEEIDQKGEDHCLSGDMLIPTAKGTFSIRDLVGTEGQIWSPENRWSPYLNCRLTRKNADVVKVVFEDKSFIVCTPDHEFLNSSGFWKKAVDLINETCYVSIQKPNLEGILCASKLSAPRFKSLMEFVTTCVVHISKRRGKGFIWPFLNIIMVQYQRALKSITRTWTEVITRTKILREYRSSLITLSMENGMTMPIGLVLKRKEPPSGMVVKKELSGIKINTESTVRRPLKHPALKARVSCVIKNLSALRVKDTVLVNVNSGIGIKSGAGWNQEPVSGADNFSRRYGLEVNKRVHSLALQNYDGRGLKAVKVLPSGKSDVYCLTVPTFHSFFLANNILSSNCFDEVAFMAMARPLMSKGPEIQVIRRPPSGGSEAAHLEREAIMAKITEAEQGGDLPW